MNTKIEVKQEQVHGLELWGDQFHFEVGKS